MIEGDDGMMTCFVCPSRAPIQLLEDIWKTAEERTEDRCAKQRAGKTCRLRSTAETSRLKNTAAAQSSYCCGAERHRGRTVLSPRTQAEEHRDYAGSDTSRFLLVLQELAPIWRLPTIEYAPGATAGAAADVEVVSARGEQPAMS